MPKEKVNSGDVKDMEQFGTSVMDATVQTEGPQNLAQQRKSLSDQLGRMTQGQTAFDTLLEDALTIKGKHAAKFPKRRKELQKNLLTVDQGKDLQGLTPQDAMGVIRERAANIRAEITHLDSQKTEADTRRTELIESARGFVGDFLDATSLKYEDLKLRQQDEKDIVDLAFSPMILESGVIPDNLPKEYIAAWEAASTEAKRQQKLSESRSGSGKQKDSFDAAALFAINEMEAGQATWGNVWNELKAYFPEKSDEEIDMALGGGRRQISSSMEGVAPEYEWYGRAQQYGTLPDPLERDLYEYGAKAAIDAQYKTTGKTSGVDDMIAALQQQAAAEAGSN